MLVFGGVCFFLPGKTTGGNEVALRFSKVWLTVVVAGKKLGKDERGLKKKTVKMMFKC